MSYLPVDGRPAPDYREKPVIRVSLDTRGLCHVKSHGSLIIADVMPPLGHGELDMCGIAP